MISYLLDEKAASLLLLLLLLFLFCFSIHQSNKKAGNCGVKRNSKAKERVIQKLAMQQSQLDR